MTHRCIPPKIQHRSLPSFLPSVLPSFLTLFLLFFSPLLSFVLTSFFVSLCLSPSLFAYDVKQLHIRSGLKACLMKTAVRCRELMFEGGSLSRSSYSISIRSKLLFLFFLSLDSFYVLSFIFIYAWGKNSIKIPFLSFYLSFILCFVLPVAFFLLSFYRSSFHSFYLSISLFPPFVLPSFFSIPLSLSRLRLLPLAFLLPPLLPFLLFYLPFRTKVLKVPPRNVWVSCQDISSTQSPLRLSPTPPLSPPPSQPPRPPPDTFPQRNTHQQAIDTYSAEGREELWQWRHHTLQGGQGQ